MNISRRDEDFPSWEPIPWGLVGSRAGQQEIGFQKRALKPIVWTRAPWGDFPKAGIFGQERDWFVVNDIAFYATFDGEDLVLVRNRQYGFPYPPEWGLASRPEGVMASKWSMWGHFPDLPTAWTVPLTSQ